MARLFNRAAQEYLENTSFAALAEPLTLAAWFYSDNATAFQMILGVGDDSADKDWTIQAAGNIAGDPIYAQSFTGGTPSEAVTTTGYSTNTWHHACGLFIAANSRAAFIDGGSKGTNAGNQVVNGIDTVRIGTAADQTIGYFSGRIAEAAVWDVALADEEVASLAKGYSPLLIRPQSLIAYWPLVRDEDQDRVGGFDLTAINTPSIAPHSPAIYPK